MNKIMRTVAALGVGALVAFSSSAEARKRLLRRTEKQIVLPSEKRPWLKKEVTALLFKAMTSPRKELPLPKEKVLEMGRQMGLDSEHLAEFQSAFSQAAAKGVRPLPMEASSN